MHGLSARNEKNQPKRVVTLVAVIDVDAALFSADIRATEKLAQLVTQLAGRAGRAEKLGEMWLQTHQPGHPLVQELVNNGYAHVARELLTERRQALAIPFIAQAIIRAEAQDQSRAHSVLQQARQAIETHFQARLIGPVQTLLEKRQGRHRMMLIVQANERKTLHRQLHVAIAALSESKIAKQVRWSVDVDAIDVT